MPTNLRYTQARNAKGKPLCTVLGCTNLAVTYRGRSYPMCATHFQSLPVDLRTHLNFLIRLSSDERYRLQFGAAASVCRQWLNKRARQDAKLAQKARTRAVEVRKRIDANAKAARDAIKAAEKKAALAALAKSFTDEADAERAARGAL